MQSTRNLWLFLVLALTVVAAFLPIAQAYAQTPSEGGYGNTTDTDHDGFNPGWLGLIGLFGLLGLRHKHPREDTYRRTEPQGSRA